MFFEGLRGLKISVEEFKNVKGLRELLVNEALKKPELLGMKRCKRLMNELKTMLNMRKSVFQEILIFVSKIFGISVFVHFGGKQPIVYHYEGNCQGGGEVVLHLQYLEGTHYNLVKENWAYERMDTPTPIDCPDRIEEEDFQEADQEAVNDIRIMFVHKGEYAFELCEHLAAGCLISEVTISNRRCCALIDSGAQVSLVRRSVVNGLIGDGISIVSEPLRLTIVGLGEGEVCAYASVKICLESDSGEGFEHQFVILENEAMPCCFLLGIDFLKVHRLSVDVAHDLVLRDGKVVMEMKDVSDEHGFVGVIELGIEGASEVLTDQDICDMQESCPLIRELKECVVNELPVRKWSDNLSEYSRYFRELVECAGVLYYCRKDQNGENMYVPAMSVVGVIGLTVIIHRKYGHLGKHKLWHYMKGVAFNPSLLKICVDVATTCVDCQKRKIHGQEVRPPLLKVDAKEPFDLVVADCVSMPPTSSGYIGILVVVDHKSKFCYTALLRDKKSSRVARMMEGIILPMMIRKPRRCLTDNGPEFAGDPFKQMLRKNGIHKVPTTPNMPSSNGLAERTIRTLCEILRMLETNGRQWDENVAQAVWSYNATLHTAHGMSPSRYLLQSEKIGGNDKLSEGEQEYWRECTSRFRSFNVGDKVLKVRNEVGKLNVNKLNQKYNGPYVVKKKWSNELSYVLEDDVGEEIRAHQSQLRKFREPPNYLKLHPVYSMPMDEEMGDKVNVDEGTGPVIIMHERTKKRKKVKRTSKLDVEEKSHTTGTEMENAIGLSPLEGREFSGFGQTDESESNDFSGFSVKEKRGKHDSSLGGIHIEMLGVKFIRKTRVSLLKTYWSPPMILQKRLTVNH